MKLVLDSDVLLDFVLARSGFVHEIDALFQRQTEWGLEFATTGCVLQNVHYIAEKGALGLPRTVFEQLLARITVIPVAASHLARALDLSDFEDAVVAFAAADASADYVITRNLKDFRKIPGISSLTPREFTSLRSALG